MSPLLKCRSAKGIPLKDLSVLLKTHYQIERGASVATLMRLEKSDVERVHKKLIVALVDIFKEFGLTEDHVTSPKDFPDFIANYNLSSENIQHQIADTGFSRTNEASVLTELTNHWIENSATSTASFAKSLYEKLSEDNLVDEAPPTMNEYERWVNTAQKRVCRMLSGEALIPLAWKYHWIAALPEEIANKAMSFMVANSGFMLVPIPTNSIDKHSSKAKIDEISRQFADVISQSQPAMDGAYNHQDDPADLQVLQDELMELVAACLRESSAIEQSTGVQPKITQIWLNSPLSS